MNVITYTCTAHEYNEESLEYSSISYQPHETDKEDDTEDVLDTREVNTEDRTKLAILRTETSK